MILFEVDLERRVMDKLGGSAGRGGAGYMTGGKSKNLVLIIPLHSVEMC